MINAAWWSQPFPPDGGAAADTLARVLGGEGAVTLVREAAQNSWDARLPGARVRFGAHLSTLSGGTLSAWRQIVGPLPYAPQGGSPLDHPSVRLLRVSDRGTGGLGGPLRANEQTDARADFVAFLRNVGEPRDQELGGGTFGLGKTIFYALSTCRTILVDTTTIVGGSRTRRLMGASLGEQFAHGSIRFTGRHWWGAGKEHVCDPLQDDDADEAADALGLPGFPDGGTGTDIYVLAPESLLGAGGDGRLDLPAEGRYLASAILWNLWPKMVDRGSGIPMSFEVTVEGEPVDLPSPAGLPRLQGFVDALRKLDDPGLSTPAPSRSVEPRDIGRFAFVKSIAPRRGSGNELEETAQPFEGPSHHCARMRQAELVVDYFPGPPFHDPMGQYAAVFRASAEADNAFAAAEPPTHDTWKSNQPGLKGTAMGAVRHSISFVKKQMDGIVSSPGAPTGGSGASTVKVANRLSALLPGTPGSRPVPGGGVPGGGGSGGGGGGGSRNPVSTIGEPRIVLRDGRPAILTEVRVKPGDRPVRVEAVVDVPSEDAKSGNALLGAIAPSVLGWYSTEEPVSLLGDDVSLDLPASSQARSLLLWLRLPDPPALTRVQVRGKELDAGGSS